MAPTATGSQPEYDITLSDGSATIGLMAGGAAGQATGAIRRLPRGPGVERKTVIQRDWTGGRGGDRFSTDTTRFADSLGLWSMTPGQAITGPLMRYSKPAYRPGYSAWPNDPDQAGNPFHVYQWTELQGAASFLAISFTAATAITLAFRQCMFIVRRVGAPASGLTVSLRNNSGSAPGTIIASATVIGTADITDYVSRVQEFVWAATQNLTNGVTYWISIGATGGTAADHWEALWGFSHSSTTVAVYASADGSSWAAADASPSEQPSLFFRVYAEVVQRVHRFFRYKRQLYCATDVPGLASAAKVYMNGDRGVATGTQTTAKLVDTTKAWTTDQWRGCVVQIIKGPNAVLARKILSNTATDLVIQSGSSGQVWPTAPTAGASGSEYVILGSDTWVQHAVTLNGNCSDVAVMNEIGYIACGSANAIRRFREYNNAGAWTVDHADDGTNKADLLEVIQEGAIINLYRGNNDTVQFSAAPSVAWATNLTFGTAAPVGDPGSIITGMTIYNDAVFFGKEDAVYQVKTGVATRVEIPIDTATDILNGVGMKGWNQNLYFAFLDGIERLFGNTVDDIGPNRGQGLPVDRRGVMAAFLPVLQYAFVAWDGDEIANHFSSIFATTSPGGDWHEVFRAPGKNQRIQTLFYQSVPGAASSRLWFGCGSDLGYLTLPNSPQNPLNDDQMAYTWESDLATAWIDTDAPGLDHLFDELRLTTLNVSGTALIAVEYQVDTAAYTSPWLTGTMTFGASPNDRGPILDSAGKQVTGRRLRLRLRLMTGDAYTPIVINAIELRVNQLNEVLYDFVIDLRLVDKVQLLSGGEASDSVLAIIAQLQAWQEVAKPLTLRCKHPVFDNVVGHIDPVALVPQSWNPEESTILGSLTFKQT